MTYSSKLSFREDLESGLFPPSYVFIAIWGGRVDVIPSLFVYFFFFWFGLGFGFGFWFLYSPLRSGVAFMWIVLFHASLEPE